MTIERFLGSLSEADFDSQFLKLSRTEAFSAVASEVGTHKDIESVRNSLMATNLPTRFYQDDESVRIAVGWIADRIMRKKK